MKVILTIAMVLTLLSGSANASASETDRSMSNIVSACAGNDKLQLAICIGYVQGVIALTRNAAREDIILPAYMASRIPSNAKFEEMFPKVVSMMSAAVKANPAKTESIAASGAIVAALSRLYPCSKP